MLVRAAAAPRALCVYFLATFCDVCGTGDEESEIRAQIKKWEENTDVYDLTGQAIGMFTSNVR